MKYLLAPVVIAVTVVASMAFGATAYAAGFWQATISTPAGTQNSKTFNIDFTTLSTNSTDTFSVELYQNGALASTSSTSAPYGDSGAFAVTVPADGVYSYYIKTTNEGQGETKTSATRQVTVDSTPPQAPVYLGTTRTGNTYTVTFIAPADADVSQVNIYGSTFTTFTADATTLLGTVNVVPGQQSTFTYTAPDGQQRYLAVQSFDGTSNGSAAAGEPNVTVNVPVAAAGVAAAGIALAAADGGDVAGAQGGAADGEVNANGGASTFGVTQSNGDILGENVADEKDDSGSSQAIAYAIIIAVVIAAIAYRFRAQIASFFKQGN